MTFTNNVTRMLDSKNIPYTLHPYDYDSGIHSATDVAAAIGLPKEQVFKTLVSVPDDPTHKPMLVVIPGPNTLNLKTLAKAVGVKKVRMAAHDQAESLTGLQTGGISPLALLNKGFVTYVSKEALDFDRIAISAGERGVNLSLATKDLIKLTRREPSILGNRSHESYRYGKRTAPELETAGIIESL